MLMTSPITGLPDGRGLNVAYESVDRHASGSSAERTALRWYSRDGSGRELSYGELAERTSRFANTLRSLAVGPAERVGILLGRVPELHVALLGTLKNASVAVPLSLDFEGEFLHLCLLRGWVRVLVTTPALYAERIAPFRARLPDLKYVLLVGEDGMLPAVATAPGVHDLHAMFRRVPAEFTIPVTDSEDPALLCFTRSAAGRPVGTLYLHRMVLQQHLAAGVALDLIAGDVYWCMLDPTTPTGVCQAVIAPLTHGVTVLVAQEGLKAEEIAGLLKRGEVDVWYTTHETITAMRRRGVGMRPAPGLTQLRVVASEGSPVTPGDRGQSLEIFGHQVRQSWGQPETGGIVIANPATGTIRPGSLGRPLPGVEAAIVRRRLDGHVDVLGPSATGELALRGGVPAMFRNYIGEAPRYKARFADGWYLSGDKAVQDEDGWFWLVERGEASAHDRTARETLDFDLLNLRACLAEPPPPGPPAPEARSSGDQRADPAQA